MKIIINSECQVQEGYAVVEVKSQLRNYDVYGYVGDLGTIDKEDYYDRHLKVFKTEKEALKEIKNARRRYITYLYPNGEKGPKYYFNKDKEFKVVKVSYIDTDNELVRNIEDLKTKLTTELNNQAVISHMTLTK